MTVLGAAGVPSSRENLALCALEGQRCAAESEPNAEVHAFEEPTFGHPFDASDDIQDIDRRLNALQEFLIAAKAPR